MIVRSEVDGGSVYLAPIMRPVIAGVVAGHLRLRHLWLLRPVVISILLPVPPGADVVTSLTFRKESIAPEIISN